MNTFIFLSETFYKDYPKDKYPEIEQKNNRPYIYIAMQNASGTLQSSIKIEVDPSIEVILITSDNKNTIQYGYGIEKYSSFFNNIFNLIDNENYHKRNYFNYYLQ